VANYTFKAACPHNATKSHRMPPKSADCAPCKALAAGLYNKLRKGRVLAATPAKLHTGGMYETTSLKNHFLLPMPQMRDPKFAKSLIYLVEHGEQGSMGLVIWPIC